MPLPSCSPRAFAFSSLAVAGFFLPLRATAQTPRTPLVPLTQNRSIPVPTPPITPEELQEWTGGPTLVTWSGRNVYAPDAIRALLDAANLAPFYRGEAGAPLKSVSLNWQNTPFWEAAHDVEVQAGGQWVGGNAGTLVFASHDPRPLLVGTRVNTVALDERLAAQTPFVTVRAASLSRAQTTQVRLGAELPAGPDATELSMTAYFDPKLRVRSLGVLDAKLQTREEGLPVAASWAKSALEDDSPRDIFMRNIFAMRPFSAFRPDVPNALTTRFALKIPSEIAGGTRLFRVSGRLHATVTSAPQTWTVPDLVATPQVTRTMGKARYSVEEVAVKGNELSVRLSATPPAILAFPTTWWPFSTATVRDAHGHTLRGSLLHGSHGIIYGPEKTQVEFSFRLPSGPTSGPYSLTWPVSTEPRSLDVPFELRDVLVP